MILNDVTSQALNPNMADSLYDFLLSWVFINLSEVSTQLFEQLYLCLPNVDECSILRYVRDHQIMQKHLFTLTKSVARPQAATIL